MKHAYIKIDEDYDEVGRLFESLNYSDLSASFEMDHAKHWYERSVFRACFEKLQAGDELIIAKPDQICNSTMDMLGVFDLCLEKQIDIYFINIDKVFRASQEVNEGILAESLDLLDAIEKEFNPMMSQSIYDDKSIFLEKHKIFKERLFPSSAAFGYPRTLNPQAYSWKENAAVAKAQNDFVRGESFRHDELGKTVLERSPDDACRELFDDDLCSLKQRVAFKEQLV